MVMGLSNALQGCVMNEDVSGPGTAASGGGQKLYFNTPDSLQEIARTFSDNEVSCNGSDNAFGFVLAGSYCADGKRDYIQAQKYFGKVCLLKHDLGCRFMGTMFEKGLGTRINYQAARDIYDLACQYSEGRNCDALATLYIFGRGVRQDINKAFEINLKSCNLDGGTSCYQVGLAHEYGQGTELDYKKAKEYFGKACDLMIKLGCDGYRRLNELGY